MLTNKTKDRPEVELTYMKRLGTSEYYFEVWVRSAVRPDVKQGSIVDRSHHERRDIAVVAAALAVNLMDQYGEGQQDPDRAASAAMNAYDTMTTLNPIPKVGDEKSI